MRSRLVCEPGALLFLRHAAVQGVTPVWLCSDEPRTEPPGLGHTWPSPSNVEIFPLVLEMRAVSRKPMGRWQEFKRKDCQILLHLSELLRVEERQWEECFCEIFLSNFNLYSTFQLPLPLSFSLCPVVCPSVFDSLPCVCLDQPVCLFLCQPVCLPCCHFAALSAHHLFLEFCSHTSDSTAHRWCWHLLRDPGRWQGAQSLPEGQGAAGDQAPQPHGEGEWPGRASRIFTALWIHKFLK